ncbi:SIMPL domain-containing protein [Lacinutrix sp. 5H-3-7-4]|uniref:SIMPL domain-containing protein n=1 Tax=Lacinutrix sp. (strain 5H-3-7-4) TaxID=983544 RepID=UPI00020A3A8D|nr:SIMPL domain-containing protein [Lacinutrix sp. 5H-3-7-4]AEH02063.1 hypothetical protein Lacal_2218 [Lacinutrix sp. 5H-3-7-4]
MKNLIFLLAVLFAMPAIFQENDNTISVFGETENTVEGDSYIVLIALQQVLVYEGQTEVEANSLKTVKENAIEKFKSIGIDFNRFKRNTYYEFAVSFSQNRESAYYFLRTSNKEEIRKIITLKSAGMSIVNIEVEAKKLTGEELVALTVKAIANAKEKAEGIAKKMNKTLGEVVHIADTNSSLQYMQSYGTTTARTHGVNVTFKLN